MRNPAFFAILTLFFTSTLSTQAGLYPWLDDQKKEYDPKQSITNRIMPPTDYVRVEVKEGSYQEWLRFLPLKEEKAPVRFYDGYAKANQADHIAVIDIDAGDRDLQQCADAIMRLRAEYLYSQQRMNCIHFNATNGQRIDYCRWTQGERPVVKGKTVSWKNSGKTGETYNLFRDYMTLIFQYAGTLSLSKELQSIKNIKDMQIGDILIEGGSPGHAVIVLDMAENPKTKKKVFLIAQSYMPAQDVHILVNYIDEKLSPWYELNFKELETPVWIFDDQDLKRFRE